MQSNSFIVYLKTKTFIDFPDSDIVIFVYQLFDFFIILRCQFSFSSALAGTYFH